MLVAIARDSRDQRHVLWTVGGVMCADGHCFNWTCDLGGMSAVCPLGTVMNGVDGVGPLRPPVAMALARREEQPPSVGDWAYEPKLDGWRALLFAMPGVLQSRRDNNLAHRFPEVIRAARQLGEVVLDGELVALREGRLDFGALAAPPTTRAAAGVTIYYTAFDLLSGDSGDLRARPYRERRVLLVRLLTGMTPPLQLIPVTADLTVARAWLAPELADVGVEGLVAKKVSEPYRAGRTGDWRKVRSTVVVDAVVVGVTGSVVRPEALVLARPDPTGLLKPVGLSLPLPPPFRDAAARHVTPTGEPVRRLPGTILGHPGAEYLPVLPTLVVEIEADPTITSFANRLRPRVHRLRPDQQPDQLG
jgi:ATP-dependent DNA ligase